MLELWKKQKVAAALLAAHQETEEMQFWRKNRQIGECFFAHIHHFLIWRVFLHPLCANHKNLNLESFIWSLNWQNYEFLWKLSVCTRFQAVSAQLPSSQLIRENWAIRLFRKIDQSTFGHNYQAFFSKPKKIFLMKQFSRPITLKPIN